MYCIWYIELFWKFKSGLNWFWFELEEKNQNFSGLAATGRPVGSAVSEPVDRLQQGKISRVFLLTLFWLGVEPSTCL